MRHDILQLTELLRDKITVNSFIEIGSRDGHDTNYISRWWGIDPKNCYIVEAHPQCYDFITRTYPTFQTLNIAASDITGIVEFNAGIIGIESNVGISSLLDRTKDGFICTKIEVDAWRMDEVMNHLNIDQIDLAKIDVEGFALQVLKGFGSTLNMFKALQIELETKEVWANQSYYDDVVSYLSEFGFTILNEVYLDEYQKDVIFVNTKKLNLNY
jgi:FkbM family methyltransferase